MPPHSIRQASLQGFDLQDYVDESIAFLREYEPQDGYFVGFSGGKDSIVTLELCRMSGVKHFPYYTCTRIDPPEMYKFIKANYPNVKWLFSKKPFWTLLQQAGPPSRLRRWCCAKIKEWPSYQIALKHRVMGIRKEESKARASRPRISELNKHALHYKPIFYWPEWAIWEFIEANNLPSPQLYEQGFSRIGCVCCPFTFSPAKPALVRLARSQARWPGIWKVFEHAVIRWFCNKHSDKISANKIKDCAYEFYNIYIRGGAIGQFLSDVNQGIYE